MNTATQAIGQRLVELCKQGQNLDAINDLYADNVVSVEASQMPGGDNCPGGFARTVEGIDQIRAKNQWWIENHQVHSGSCDGPFPHEPDRFAVVFKYDVTFKPASQRMAMEEVGLYTVADGKIVKEEFFYAMPGQ